MTNRELIEMIESTCNGDVQETIEILNELINDIHINPNQFVSKLNQDLEKYCNNLLRCPCCGHELEEKRSNERYEAYGSECDEPFITYNCINPDCNNY